MDPELVQKLIPLSITHAIAFLIFYWILKRYALGPVLKLLDERRERIAKEFDQIATSEKRISTLKDEYEDRLRKIDEEARKRTMDEVNRGKRIADEIVDNARAEAADIVEKARAKLQLDVDQARIRLKDDIVGLIMSSTERLLRERIDDAKQRQLVKSFVEELEQRK